MHSLKSDESSQYWYFLSLPFIPHKNFATSSFCILGHRVTWRQPKRYQLFDDMVEEFASEITIAYIWYIRWLQLGRHDIKTTVSLSFWCYERTSSESNPWIRSWTSIRGTPEHPDLRYLNTHPLVALSLTSVSWTDPASHSALQETYPT